MLNAKRRTLFGKTNQNVVSRFIEEIGTELMEGYNSPIKVETKIEDMYEEHRNEELKTGDQDNHTVYGDGIVISINKDLATIAFSHQVGIKTIVKTHKNLSKILYFE